MSLINLPLLLLTLITVVIAQYDPYGQRPYNQNTDRSTYNQYDRNNPNNPNSPYDRAGQGLSDRERYDRFDNRNRTDPYGQNPYDRDRYGSPNPYDRDRNNNPYDRNRNGSYPYGSDRNRPDAYGPYGNRSDPYDRNQPYDSRYGQGQGQGQGQGPYDRYPGQPGGNRGHDDGTCCEDYCYERDRDKFWKFGPVTAYQFVSARFLSGQDIGCSPVFFWSLNKHGTNLPTKDVLDRLKNLDKTREDIIRNYNEQQYPLRGRLCPEDYDLLNRWRVNESISYSQGNELTAGGKEELKMLARRFQNKYRDLLSVPYSESHYYFKYANADRTYDSYQAFLEGLFNNNAFNVHAVVDNGDQSLGYRSCYGGSYSSSSAYDPNNQNSGYNDQRYSSGGYGSGGYGSSGGSIGGSSGGYQGANGYSQGSGYAGANPQVGGSGYNSGGSGYNQGSGGYSSGGYNTGSNYAGGYGSNSNPNRDYEFNQFKRNPEYMDVVKNVFRRLGYQNYLPNEAVIEDIYNMCRYERALYPDRPSAWCAAFNKKQLEVLEYAEDLRGYFANGYGNEDVSNRLGCGILKDLYRRMQRVVEGYSSDQKVAITFGSPGSIENLLVAMGYAKDYTPLNAQNYYSQSRRKWRIADLSPFAANLAAVVHECPSNSADKYKVTFHLNEGAMDFPECNAGTCSWETVRSKFEDIVNRCDYCSGSSTAQIFLPVFLTTAFVLILYRSW